MRSFVVITLIALSMPAAGASWSVWGSTEPDTRADATSGWMFTSPDSGPLTDLRVYFDVVGEATVLGQNNPNVAGMGPLFHPPSESFTAFLGVWKDCNRDGYVGISQAGVLEYRAELLLDTKVCPKGSRWNDGLWVIEMLPIGPRDDSRAPGSGSYVLPRLIPDDSARVWGDDGPPNGAAILGSCQVAPLPRGTTASTGALVRFGDCYDEGRGQQAAGAAPDQHAPLSLYGDPTDPRGPQAGLLQRHTGDPSFEAFDCSQPPTTVHDPFGAQSVDATDPTPGHILTGSVGVEGIAQFDIFHSDDGTAGTYHKAITDPNGNIARAGGISPSLRDPTGSYTDAASDSERATLEACDPNANAFSLYAPGQAIDLAPAAEADAQGVDPVLGKRQNDIVFDLTQYTSSYQEGGTVPDGRTGAPFFGDLLGHDMPQDGGLAPARDVGGTGPGWHSLTASPLRQASFTRSDLDPTFRSYHTFYAYVGTSAVANFGLHMPRGAALGVYGQEWCAGTTNGVHAGWDCGVSDWWAAPLASARPQNPYSHRQLGASIGDFYDLRDVDCEPNSPLAQRCV